MAPSDEEATNTSANQSLAMVLPAIGPEDMFLLLKLIQIKIQKKVIFQKNLSAPIKKNQVIGKLEYSYHQKNIGSVSILASHSVKKATYLDYLKKLILSC